MNQGVILWADDEIDLLKPHILFLRAKGYEVVTVSNGRDALDAVATRPFDLVILDENMPGNLWRGLTTSDLSNRLPEKINTTCRVEACLDPTGGVY